MDSTIIIEKSVIIVVVFALTMLMAMYSTWAERKVAAWLQDRVGPNRAGAWGLLQPLADGLKLFFKDEIRQIKTDALQLFELLQSLSEQHKSVLLPGYTHGQIAMPSSFGLWFGAYAETLVDDMHTLVAAWRVANQNPLGSAAGYGSSFPLDREMTTRELDFETMNYNVLKQINTFLDH